MYKDRTVFDRFRASPYNRAFMPDRLPEFIEPLRLAERGRVLQGRLPLSRFRRLAESLVTADGHAQVVLEFGMDEQGRPTVEGDVATELMLRCQRCLEPMALSLDLPVRLVLVRSEAQEQNLPTGFEAMVVGEKPSLLADIIEDELLLGLPLVPMHAPKECRRGRHYEVDAGEGADESHSPFEVLAKLKQDRTR